MSENRNTSDGIPNVKWVIGGVTFTWVAYSLFLYMAYWPKPGAAGEFGDAYGVLTSLFTALAFAAVWWTGSLQKTELKEQRLEIKSQREALERTDATQRIQQFENSFFNMVKLLRELEDNILYVVSNARTSALPREERGLAAARHYANDLSRLIASAVNDSDVITEKPVTRSDVANAYNNRVQNTGTDYWSPYFRILFNILRLIDTTFSERTSHASKDTDVRRRMYGNIIRAQLSSPVLVVLSANALCEHAGTMQKYLSMFHLLKYMERGRYRDKMETLYPPDAFLSRDSD